MKKEEGRKKRDWGHRDRDDALFAEPINSRESL